MPEIQVITGVTDARKQTVINNFKADGATEVTSEKENGTWKITATFPD